MDYLPEDQVRLLISDVSTDAAKQILTDAQVGGYLAINAGNVRLAAADALDAIASSEALVSKVIRTQDLATDGAKVADALRRHATSLRALAGADDEGVFDIVAPTTTRPELTNRGYSVWGL
ncbi:MAG TPA: hypothetical protein VFJ94_10755 [Intrasporangium sp.]|uniref:hypothetical protein n=1 Tax=Intrasporangium sp. TaxID=1925024 RepID=UPI002D7797E8|nr:hypothetical protein [Intrasporangium sp.]HET7398990.1 hypothetical protein [Intrasporangium sp.]